MLLEMESDRDDATSIDLQFCKARPLGSLLYRCLRLTPSSCRCLWRTLLRLLRPSADPRRRRSDVMCQRRRFIPHRRLTIASRFRFQ